MGFEAPPESVVITQKTEKIDSQNSFSSSMIEEMADRRGFLNYDIVIDLPHSDYFFDVELKNDFLTGNFRMVLLAHNEEFNKWE